MMAYVDTSSRVPLRITGPSSPRCRELWDAAEHVVACRIAYVESAAAITVAERLGRILASGADSALTNLSILWPQLDLIELDDTLTRAAAHASRTHGLGGHDTVHFAAACPLDGGDVVAVCGDAQLLTAWRAAGFAAADSTA